MPLNHADPDQTEDDGEIGHARPRHVLGQRVRDLTDEYDVDEVVEELEEADCSILDRHAAGVVAGTAAAAAPRVIGGAAAVRVRSLTAETVVGATGFEPATARPQPCALPRE